MFPRLCALKVWCFTRGRPGRTGKICTGYFWSVQSVNVENYIKNILRFKKALEKLLDFRTNFPLFSLHNKKEKCRAITTLLLVIVLVYATRQPTS